MLEHVAAVEVVVLTPACTTRHTSEHSFLAQQMGVELVEEAGSGCG
jgi:uncharacterized circularly permuted ATP-grasp superfamily protein